MKPPWKDRGVTGHPALPGNPVKWLHINELKAVHQTEASTRKRHTKPIDTSKPYPALVVNDKKEIQDGHHRYFNLKRDKYVGMVPVVVNNFVAPSFAAAVRGEL